MLHSFICVLLLCYGTCVLYLVLHLYAYATVRCRTQLVDKASRCFVLNGAFTLSASQYAPWAIPVAQQATEHVMNNQQALDDAHPLIRHVLYLEPVDSQYNPRKSPPNEDAAATSSPIDIASRDGISTGWAWTVGISAVLVCMTVVWVWRRHLRSPKGSYDDANQGCCKRIVANQTLITRGYLEYPSPDPSPRQRMWQQNDNDDNPDAVMPSHGPDEPWSYPQVSFNEGESVPQFDPVLAIDSSNLANDQEEWNQIIPDGSFPSTGGNALPNDDDSFAPAFQDDDDDLPAAPSSSWLRDLV